MELSRAANTYAVLECPFCNQKIFLLVQRQELTLQRRTPLFLWYLVYLNDSSTKYTVRANMIPKLIRETNIHFGLCMTKNKPAKVELKSAKHLKSLLSRIILLGEGDKKCHVSCANNWVPHIIIIKSIRKKVAITWKLPLVANHERRCPFVCFKHLLSCKNCISAILAKDTKGFLKAWTDLS